MDEREAVIKSENNNDQISKTKTIYDVSTFEIVWRNFLAGVSRSLGGIIIYIFLLFIFGSLFLNFILPKFQPTLDKYLNIFNSLETLNSQKPSSGFTLPENLDIQKLLGQ